MLRLLVLPVLLAPESLEDVKNLSELGRQEAGVGITTTPPPLSTDEETAVATDTGVRQIGDMSTEEIGLRLNGYKRRAQNLERLPENYRREQAELSVQEMVDQGFPETVARGVFSNLLGPSLETVLQEGGYGATEGVQGVRGCWCTNRRSNAAGRRSS